MIVWHVEPAKKPAPMMQLMKAIFIKLIKRNVYSVELVLMNAPPEPLSKNNGTTPSFPEGVVL